VKSTRHRQRLGAYIRATADDDKSARNYWNGQEPLRRVSRGVKGKKSAHIRVTPVGIRS